MGSEVEAMGGEFRTRNGSPSTQEERTRPDMQKGAAWAPFCGQCREFYSSFSASLTILLYWLTVSKLLSSDSDRPFE